MLGLSGIKRLHVLFDSSARDIYEPPKKSTAITLLLAAALDVIVRFETLLPLKFFGVLTRLYKLELPGKKLQPR